MYPYTSDIIQRIEDMLDAMEPLYLCNEIVGKKCLWVSSYLLQIYLKSVVHLWRVESLRLYLKRYIHKFRL